MVRARSDAHGYRPLHGATDMKRCAQRCMMHLLLLWIAVWLTLSGYVAVSLCSRYAHGEHRTVSELASMILGLWVVLAVLTAIVVLCTFAVTQALLGIAFSFFLDFSPASICALLAAVIALSLVSFKCYDYIVPSFRWYTDQDPYWVHGFTMRRWLPFLGIQALLTVFSGWRLRRGNRISDAHGRR